MTSPKSTAIFSLKWDKKGFGGFLPFLLVFSQNFHFCDAWLTASDGYNIFIFLISFIAGLILVIIVFCLIYKLWLKDLLFDYRQARGWYYGNGKVPKDSYYVKKQPPPRPPMPVYGPGYDVEQPGPRFLEPRDDVITSKHWPVKASASQDYGLRDSGTYGDGEYNVGAHRGLYNASGYPLKGVYAYSSEPNITAGQGSPVGAGRRSPVGAGGSPAQRSYYATGVSDHPGGPTGTGAVRTVEILPVHRHSPTSTMRYDGSGGIDVNRRGGGVSLGGGYVARDDVVALTSQRHFSDGAAIRGNVDDADFQGPTALSRRYDDSGAHSPAPPRRVTNVGGVDSLVDYDEDSTRRPRSPALDAVPTGATVLSYQSTFHQRVTSSANKDRAAYFGSSV